MTALTNRVEALEAARAHSVSRLPASAQTQTDAKDLPLKARLTAIVSSLLGAPMPAGHVEAAT